MLVGADGSTAPARTDPSGDREDREDRIKVLDFGMAHVEEGRSEGERLTQSGVIFGTLHYMSPEQCRGTGIGPPSDIYSVGVMLYEMLCGVVPFDSKSPAELMTQHLFVSPPPIEQRAPGRVVPPELLELALWAMSKQPEKRPTATQLREVLLEAAVQNDAFSAQRRLHKARIAAMGLSRTERALTPAQAATDSPRTEGEATVALLGFGEGEVAEVAEVAEIQGALGANNLHAQVWSGQAPFRDAESAMVGPAQAAVLAYGPRAAAVLQALRRDPTRARLPVLVSNVPRAAMPALISAGASDIALTGTEAGELCRKLWRLVSRGR